MLDLYDATISELQQGIRDGDFSSVDLTKAYIKRIQEVNDEVRAVLCISPKALQDAAARDLERKEGKYQSGLHGIPILLKDNITTRHEDGMDTTAGSFALKGAKVGDARIVKLLREAGAVVLGKLNMSEWAMYRDWKVLPSGWSAVGGQATCPSYKDGNPIGSSSGSGVAAILALAAGTIGTETNGSIVAPSSRNSCVGLRPTVGLVSRSGIIPISQEHDSAGPMCRTVEDCALLLSVIAGMDAHDKYTSLQPSGLSYDYPARLDKLALQGKRLGIPLDYLRDWGTLWEGEDYSPKEWMRPAFNEALQVLRNLGAEVVEFDMGDIDILTGDAKTSELGQACEFKHAINEHLGTLADKVKNLSELIEFNERCPEEMPASYEGQADLVKASGCNGLNDPAYREAQRKTALATGVIDDAMEKHGIDVLLLPGVCSEGWSRATYPQIMVPLGFGPQDLKPKQVQDHPAHQTCFDFPNEPFGLTFAGTAWSEGALLSYAYAFEQATHHRRLVKPYKAAMPTAQIEAAAS